jgi:hypothetical protein
MRNYSFMTQGNPLLWNQMYHTNVSLNYSLFAVHVLGLTYYCGFRKNFVTLFPLDSSKSALS